MPGPRPGKVRLMAWGALPEGQQGCSPRPDPDGGWGQLGIALDQQAGWQWCSAPLAASSRLWQLVPDLALSPGAQGMRGG